MSRTERPGRTFGRIALGAVVHDPEPEFFTWWTSLLVEGLDDGDVVLNNHSVPTAQPIPEVHNHLVALFLKTDCDTLCLVEDDHDGPADVIRRLRSKPANLPFDIVCASYPGRRGRPFPPGWNYEGRQGEGGYQVWIELAKMRARGTQEYDGAALGCVLIRRWVLERMWRGSDVGSGLPLADAQWFRWVGHSSQDIDFYIRAKALGARTGVDRDVWLAHVGRYIWDRSDWEEARRENRVRWAWQILKQRLSLRSTAR